MITGTMEQAEKTEKIIKKLQNWFNATSTAGISNVRGEKKKKGTTLREREEGKKTRRH